MYQCGLDTTGTSCTIQELCQLYVFTLDESRQYGTSFAVMS